MIKYSKKTNEDFESRYQIHKLNNGNESGTF